VPQHHEAAAEGARTVLLDGVRCPSVLGMVQLYNGTSAWRVIWPMEYLHRRGFPVMWGYNGELDTATNTKYADVVVMHRLAWERKDYHKALLWRDILHRDGKALVYELDDDILSPSIIERVKRTNMWSKGDAQIDMERQAHVFSMRICDGIICSTEYLADVCRQYTTKPVYVVPNAIDLDRFKRVMAAEPRLPEGSPPTIGWVGGNRPNSDAVNLAAAWARIARNYPDVQFKIGGYPFPILAGAVPPDRLTFVPWRQIDAYPMAFANLDIGCATIVDEEFNRSKSTIKAMEYAAAGAAVCASPLVYGQLICHGKNGMLCETSDEWYHAISVLLDYPQQRREMAEVLTGEVEREHSLAGNIGRWPEAWTAILADFRVKSLVGGGKIGAPLPWDDVQYTRPQGGYRTGVLRGRVQGLQHP
jgi:glycosyltransferase involved in cell wall biosynthesis